VDDREILQWNKRLADQVNRGWDNYKHVHIDLSTARIDEPVRITGEFLYVEESSGAAAVAKIKLNRNTNDALDLEKGVEIKTVFIEVYITNEALEDEWLDLVIGINFEYYQAIDRGDEVQQVLNLTHANPNTNVAAAANPCNQALIKADVNNTQVAWVDFGVAAVQNDCLPLDAGEWVRIKISNTDLINANFEVGGEIVFIVFEV